MAWESFGGSRWPWGSVRCGGDEIQPLVKSIHGRQLAVVFSGEIYNEQELTRSWEAKDTG